LSKPVVHHIPVCPFSQRLEILLELKGLRDAVDFEVVDITKPRSPALLAKSRGTTALPILETEAGGIIKESLVILRYLEDRYPAPAVARADPFERAVEGMLIALEGDFTMAGYRLLMNQDRARRDELLATLVAQYARLDALLRHDGTGTTWLFDRFGLAEAVYTPLFARFWVLDYYEGFELPADGSCERVRVWRDACLAHPAAQQVTEEEIVKLYYDYAKGAGNGALVPGRRVSSFVFTPNWRDRPWPPRDKYGASASDADLGLA
jgi:glutathione S-transferase